MSEVHRTSPPDDEWNEVKDEHVEAAKAELADDPGALWDALTESAFYLEHLSSLFLASESFRDEAFRLNEERIAKRAQELADLAYESAENEHGADEWESRNEH